tara:strand:- start:7014 stop:7208 length:195 start_codon:yes stop_codon:yes gene_type:complete
MVALFFRDDAGNNAFESFDDRVVAPALVYFVFAISPRFLVCVVLRKNINRPQICIFYLQTSAKK